MANPNEGRKLEQIYAGIEDQNAGMSTPVDMSTPDKLGLGQTTIRRVAPVAPPRSAPADPNAVINAGLQAVERQYAQGGMPLDQTPRGRADAARARTRGGAESGFLSSGDSLLGGQKPDQAQALGLPPLKAGQPQPPTASFAPVPPNPALPPAQTQERSPLVLAASPGVPPAGPAGQPPPPGWGAPYQATAPAAAGSPQLPAYLTEAERATVEAATPGERAAASPRRMGDVYGESGIDKARAGYNWNYPIYGQ